ncbi:MAG: ROK family protein [Clostridia bacterium]|nr:ROK family protein [Clostridia bacterium]
MEKLFIGIDVGGTFIKAGIINENNEITHYETIKSSQSKIGDEFPETLLDLINKLLKNTNLELKNFAGIGIAMRGLIDSKKGIVISTDFLKLKNFPLAEKLSDLTSLSTKLANDADVATLAEQMIGSGQNYNDFIMLTLGTGIGGGIVLNGENLGIIHSKPVEIGHLKISDKQIKCSCGNYGCYETLGSTKALILQTKLAMKENPNSEMWTKYNLSTVSGKTVFEFTNDLVARNVLKEYIKYIGDGIINLANIFKPDIFIIGGAISNQKDNLIKPLENYVNKHLFLTPMGYSVKIVPAKLTGDAGIIGTKFLFN